MPGFPAKQSFGRVGKGGGFFQQRDFSGFIRGNLFLPLIVHPHPGPLPSREREKYVEASTPSVISEISSRGSKDFKYRGPLIKAFRNDGYGVIAVTEKMPVSQAVIARVVLSLPVAISHS